MPPALFVVAAIWLAAAGIVCELADRKGRERALWFVLAVGLSPLLACALVLLLPDARHQCPACGTRCPDGAIACRGCGRDLPPRPAAWTAPAPGAPRPARAPVAPLSRPVVILVGLLVALGVGVLGAVSWLVTTA